MAREIAVRDQMKAGVRYVATSVKKSSLFVKKGDVLVKMKGIVIGSGGHLGDEALSHIISIKTDYNHYRLMSAIHFHRSMENDRIAEAG